ncbi:MAG: carotene hydroxylase [Flavobacteriales bacterium]|jgi:beta-carotene 3-hydroxylase|nr:carotene hydroxylase [Flavobacteriales bacterium]
MLFNTVLTITTFLIMEFISWFTHKYIMHGPLWNLHLDHHQVDKKKKLQKNDYFFLIFAIPSIMAIILGSMNSNYLLYIGIGIALYGFAYFIVHEIIIHQRIKIFRNSKSRYIRAIKRAHKVHHKNIDKEDGESFGMLLVPLKYFK